MDVSIIIPAFNRLWCLNAAIDSCRGSRCEVEIIVVDDGSTDGTAEWLQQQDGLVTIIHPDNRGKCIAVNTAFELARGKYIKFLDSDDQLIPGKLDEQFNIAESSRSDIVVSGYRLVDERGNIIREQPWLMCEDFIAQQLGECDSSHYSAYLFRREFIGDIPHRSEYALRDDRMFVLEAALKNPQVSVCPGYTLLHTEHNHGRLQFTSGADFELQNRQHLAIYKKILGELALGDKLSDRRINAAINILWPLCHWIAKTDIDEGEAVLKWIKQLKPDFEPADYGITGFMYRKLGFKTTERLMRLRRRMKYGRSARNA